MFKLALSMTARDWRADRLRSGLDRDAHQLLGADVVVSADQPIQAAWRAQAAQRGLLMADTTSFPSMAQAGEGEQSLSLLASIKAVSPGYPLRGKLKITTDPAQAEQSQGAPAADTPAPGTVWIDAGLLDGLRIHLGGAIKLGEKTFKVTQLIAAEPDRGASFLSFAPRVMLALSDLPATQLIQPGSRVNYRLLVAAPTTQQLPRAAAYDDWLRAQIRMPT